jgi:hypothetical protein
MRSTGRNVRHGSIEDLIGRKKQHRDSAAEQPVGKRKRLGHIDMRRGPGVGLTGLNARNGCQDTCGARSGWRRPILKRRRKIEKRPVSGYLRLASRGGGRGHATRFE